jgi:hypothetical protein
MGTLLTSGQHVGNAHEHRDSPQHQQFIAAKCPHHKTSGLAGVTPASRRRLVESPPAALRRATAGSGLGRTVTSESDSGCAQAQPEFQA